MIELQGPPKIAGARSRQSCGSRKGCCYRAATSEVSSYRRWQQGTPRNCTGPV